MNKIKEIILDYYYLITYELYVEGIKEMRFFLKKLLSYRMALNILLILSILSLIRLDFISVYFIIGYIFIHLYVRKKAGNYRAFRRAREKWEKEYKLKIPKTIEELKKENDKRKIE